MIQPRFHPSILLTALAILGARAPAWTATMPPAASRAYDMDEGAGTTVGALDAGVTGTVDQAKLAWAAGHSGQPGDKALQQMGGGLIELVEDYTLAGPNPFTISIWAKNGTESFGSKRPMYGGMRSDGSYGLFMYRGTDGRVWFEDRGVRAGNWGSTTGASDGQWHNWVMTYDPKLPPATMGGGTGGQMRFYRDGVIYSGDQDWVNPYPEVAMTKMQLFHCLGSGITSASYWGSTSPQGAMLDDFAVWKTTLSADEAAWLGQTTNRLSMIPAPAVSYTYTPPLAQPQPTPPDLWSAGTNWTIPPAGGRGVQLVFGDMATSYANGFSNLSKNDNNGDFQLNKLTLRGSGPSEAGAVASIAIEGHAGNTLKFVDNGSATPQVKLEALTGTAGLAYNVSSNLVLSNDTDFTGDGTASFTFSGQIRGSGKLTKSGTSRLALANAGNNYAGGTQVIAGVLEIGSAGALPVGRPLAIGSGSAGQASSLSQPQGTDADACPAQAVPEPAGFALLAAGAVALWGWAWRRKGLR